MSQSSQVHRVTYFKIADDEAKQKLLDMYKVIKSKALKVGKKFLSGLSGILIRNQDQKPYIVAAEAGPTVPDKRNQGFNVAAKTTFASMEDFEFYDKECSAHKELRSYAASVNQGSMMVYFQSVV